MSPASTCRSSFSSLGSGGLPIFAQIYHRPFSSLTWESWQTLLGRVKSNLTDPSPGSCDPTLSFVSDLVDADAGTEGS